MAVLWAHSVGWSIPLLFRGLGETIGGFALMWLFQHKLVHEWAICQRCLYFLHSIGWWHIVGKARARGGGGFLLARYPSISVQHISASHPFHIKCNVLDEWQAQVDHSVLLSLAQPDSFKRQKRGKEKEHHESQQQLSYVKQTEQQWRSQVVGKGWHKSEKWDRSSSFFVFTSQVAASAPFVVLNVSAQYVPFSDFSWFLRNAAWMCNNDENEIHGLLISPLAQSCIFIGDPLFVFVPLWWFCGSRGKCPCHRLTLCCAS